MYRRCGRAQQGVELIDTLILKQGGRPTGEALVVLPNQVQVEVLLTRNQHAMGRNAIGVARVNKQVRTARSLVIVALAAISDRMQGLTSSLGESDIVMMIYGWGLGEQL